MLRLWISVQKREVKKKEERKRCLVLSTKGGPFQTLVSLDKGLCQGHMLRNRNRAKGKPPTTRSTLVSGGENPQSPVSRDGDLLQGVYITSVYHGFANVLLVKCSSAGRLPAFLCFCPRLFSTLRLQAGLPLLQFWLQVLRASLFVLQGEGLHMLLGRQSGARQALFNLLVVRSL